MKNHMQHKRVAVNCREYTEEELVDALKADQPSVEDIKEILEGFYQT